MTTAKRLTTPALAKLPTLDESRPEGLQRRRSGTACTRPRARPRRCSTSSTPRCSAALKDPEFIKRQEALGAVVVTDARLNPAEHKKFVEAEIDKWGPVIKAAGQYAD